MILYYNEGMKIPKYIIIGTVLAVLPWLFFPIRSNAQILGNSVYNPNLILGDNDILNTGTMSFSDIQDFLISRPGILKNYSTTNAYGQLKTAAEIIYDAARNNYDCTGVVLSDNPTEAERSLKCRKISTVNPQLLLVLLQKEASLIDDPNPSQGHLDAATGYGCPTGQGCNPYWKGFGKQVNSAALQFLAYMQEPQNYGFKIGETYIAKDKYSKLQTAAQAMAKPVSDPHSYTKIIASPDMVSVTPGNQATAALYNYTPHVYNGNYSTFQLWNKYFSPSDVVSPPVNVVSRIFPDGSIIKAEGNPQVWLISNGQKRHFANWSTFISRFRPEQIITVSPNEPDRYPSGAPLKFANYSLVQTPDQQIYLLVDKEKRPFANTDTYKKLGFNPVELEQASVDDLAEYKVGKTITASSTYITGVLMQDNQTNETFYVEDGSKHPVSLEIIDMKYPDVEIIKKTSKELAAFTTEKPIVLDDGSLVKTTTYPTVYLISGGKKRPFADETIFAKYGYSLNNVAPLSSQFLYNYDMGDPIQ